MSYSLTPQQKEQYRREGYVILRGLIPQRHRGTAG